MIQEQKIKITELKNKIQEHLKYLNLDSVRETIAGLEEQSKKDDFWNDQNEAGRVLKKISTLKKRVDPWDTFFLEFEDLETLYEMAIEENAEEYESEIVTSIEKLEKAFSDLEFMELLSGEHDSANAIVNIHPGAGGTEACDWASMLFRMYTRWAESKGFSYELLDWQDGEEAGIKNVTFLLKGDYGYGMLKYESGIHRLVRISPFDSNARRHTSFASIYVTPDIENDIDIEIVPSDLRIDTYRASGAGGQHVNKTDSAVRITHIPSGIVVACQNERSQHKNKAHAMKVLKARLYDLHEKQKQEELAKNNPEKKDIAWGSQIRSYVFQPYTMAKDHRTKVEIGNIQTVMDGNIDDFLNAELRYFVK